MVYADYTRPETRFIENIMKLHGPKLPGPMRIFEPACGSGRLLESLARRGHVVHGFDLNRHMVAYAKKRLKEQGLKGRVWRDQLEDFSVPKGATYDLAHCFVSTFKYILSEQGAVSCLRRLAAALRPDGLCLLGLHLTDYKKNPPDHERWIGRRPNIRVTSDTWSAPANRKARTEAMLTRMRIRHDGKVWEEETHWLFRTYSPAELKSLLRQVPELKLLECYDFRYDLAEKRKVDASHTDVLLVLRRE